MSLVLWVLAVVGWWWGSCGCLDFGGCVWILVGVWFWWVFGRLGLLGLFHTITTTVLKMVGVPTTSPRLGLYNIILTKRDGGPQTPTNPSELRRSLCVVPGPTPQTGRHDKTKAGQELTESVKLFLSDPVVLDVG